ncbi:MAG TPA: hypothetical protein VFF76_04435 [Holophagaceae bacterium]|jgi:hypothetical protein|nr:hypothetical protein [Holophagaceae bacterium]
MRLSALLCCAALGLPLSAQEYFKEEKPDPWIPAWELTAQAERQNLPPGALPNFDRSDARLRLRWTLGSEDGFQFKAGTISYLGSDGNSKNLLRQDNQPSNGSRLDLAGLRFAHFTESAGVELQGGLVENPMLASETLWDPNLRVIGGGGRVFLRTETVLEEAGLRGVAGEVRLLYGGRVRLRAGQAVARLVLGAVTATVHGGLWDLQPRQEDAPLFLRQNGGAGWGPNGYYGNYGVYGNAGGYADPHYRYEVYGAQLDWDMAVPASVSAQRQKRQEDGDIGQDFQLWVGSPTRRWWPQAGLIHQIVDTDGALGSLNGDRWWFHSDASGNRYILALNLPQRWRVSAEYMKQTRTGGNYLYTRTDLVLQKRF